MSRIPPDGNGRSPVEPLQPAGVPPDRIVARGKSGTTSEFPYLMFSHLTSGSIPWEVKPKKNNREDRMHSTAAFSVGAAAPRCIAEVQHGR
jgi:hypothetical protein